MLLSSSLLPHHRICRLRSLQVRHSSAKAPAPSAHDAHSEDIPGHDVRKEMLMGIGLGLTMALVWKSWQWNNKAERVSNNNKWEKQYPRYVAERREALAKEAAEEAAAAAAEEEPAAAEEEEETVAEVAAVDAPSKVVEKEATEATKPSEQQ